MTKMIVIYNQPKDPDAFQQHYFGVHVPLARQLPGLISYEVSRGEISTRSAGLAPYMIGVLTFANMSALQAAFASDLGKACAADRRVLAPQDGDSAMYIFEDENLTEGSSTD